MSKHTFSVPQEYNLLLISPACSVSPDRAVCLHVYPLEVHERSPVLYHVKSLTLPICPLAQLFKFNKSDNKQPNGCVASYFIQTQWMKTLTYTVYLQMSQSYSHSSVFQLYPAVFAATKRENMIMIIDIFGKKCFLILEGATDCNIDMYVPFIDDGRTKMMSSCHIYLILEER